MAKLSNIYQDKKSSLWYFVANLGTDINGKRIRHWERGFKTQREAKQSYDTYMHNYSKTSVKTNSTMSFKVFYTTYYEPEYKNSVSKHTYENRISTMRKQFSYFENIKLKDINAPQIKSWQHQLSSKYQSSYVRLVYGMFQKTLDLAVELGLLQSNISRRVKNVKKTRENIKSFWTYNEFHKVISTFDISDFYMHFAFILIWTLFTTGMRFGELQALTWSDFNIEKKTIDINKAMYYKNSQNYSLTPTKTLSSIRTISIDTTTTSHLINWRKEQLKNFHTDYIFSTNGKPTNKHTAKNYIERHSKLCGVHRIRLHDLRHSHASLLISLGENALIVRDRLGHSSVEETLKTYSHLYENAHVDVANRLSNLFDNNQEDVNE